MDLFRRVLLKTNKQLQDELMASLRDAPKPIDRDGIATIAAEVLKTSPKQLREFNQWLDDFADHLMGQLNG